jgi:transcription initiation factor IIE alpha subunit
MSVWLPIVYKPQATLTAMRATSLRMMERHERVIFIMLDGHRTVEDILLLTNYLQDEVRDILIRLERDGVIVRVR